MNVEVTGGQQILETQNTSMQMSFTGRAITDFPPGSRSALLLAQLDPGAQTVGGPRDSTFEGLPKGSINVAFDGISAQDNVLYSRDGFFAINDPRLDGVEEFGVTTNANNAFHAAASSVVGARGGLLGDLFEYKLRDRVTIKKNQSALVPIVQTDITAEKVALWNANLGMARPLRALWLTNSSSLVLDGGSFNVIDGGAFAGEGLIEALHPGEKRLISYAADLAMQVVVKSEGAPEKLTNVRVAKGIMIRTVQTRSKTTYTIRNEDSSPRTVMIEQPIRSGWKLAEDLKPAEETATAYRFRVQVKAKDSTDFVVEETTPRSSRITVNNVTEKMIESFALNQELTPELEKFLRGILAQKDAIAKLDVDITQKQQRVGQHWHRSESRAGKLTGAERDVGRKGAGAEVRERAGRAGNAIGDVEEGDFGFDGEAQSGSTGVGRYD